MSFQREWCCHFCLTVADQKGFGNRPDRCQACHIVRCKKCGTFIKGDNPKLCYGCGTFKPEVDSAFVGTDQTAGIYVEAEWMRRNKGRHSDGQYYIATGFAPDGSGRVSSWIGRQVVNADGSVGSEDVRELTEEEKVELSNAE